MIKDKLKTNFRRNARSSAVYGRVLEGLRSTPVLSALGIKNEKIERYCPVCTEKRPISNFYPKPKSKDSEIDVDPILDVRRSCRGCWDCRVTDSKTGERVSAAGVKKYDWLVKKELGLPYDEPDEGEYACLPL